MLRLSNLGEAATARSAGRVTASRRSRPRVSPTDIAATAAAILISISVGVITSTVAWEIPVAALVLAGLVILGMDRPAMFLGVLLVVRPVLDAASEDRVGIGLGVINVGGAIGLAILVIWLGYILAAPRVTLLHSSRAFGAVLAFSAAAAVLAYENFGSSSGSSAVAEVVRLAAILAVFLLAANVAAAPSSVRRLFSIVALSAVIPAVVAIVQFAGGQAVSSQGLVIERAFGTFVGPNPLGQYCAVSALILISSPATFMKRSVRLAALAIVVGALIISYSRSGYTVLLVGVVAIECQRLSRRVLWIAAVLAILLLAVPSLRDRVLPVGTTSTTHEVTSQGGLLSGGGTYGSLGWRIGNWGGLLAKWGESPIVGYGLQTTPLVNPLRTKTVVRGQNGQQVQGFSAHSTVVRALVEGGVMMLAVWILLCVALIKGSAKAMSEPWELQPYARVLWGMWVGVVSLGLTVDDPFADTAMMYGCFALTGALLVAYGQHRAACPAPLGEPKDGRKAIGA